MARVFNPNQKLSGSIGAFLIVAILFVGNTILNIATIPSLDISPNKVHTLSEITLKTIEEIDPLEPPVAIDFYYTPDVIGLPREVKEAGQKISRLLALYKEKAGDRLEIRYFRPDPLSTDETDQAVVREAHNKGIRRFEHYWNQNTSVVYCGLFFSRGKKTYLFDNIDAQLLPQLEFKITSAIYNCVQVETKTLGIISGLDFVEKTAGKDPQGNPQIIPEWQFLTRLKKEFKVKFINNPGTEIPTCDVLVVIQPRGLLSEDYQAIEQHVLKGKGALFFEAPFSFQELILLSRDQQILSSKLSELLKEEAQEAAEKAEKDFMVELEKFPESKKAWKRLQDAQEKMQKAAEGDTRARLIAEQEVQEAFRAFQMNVFTKQEVMAAFNQLREKMQQANLLAQGRARPKFDGEAQKMIDSMEAKAKEELPKGREINTRLFQKWGINLVPEKLLFVPVSEADEANLSQFSFTIGGLNGNPKCFARDRLETQNLEAFHVNFSGVIEPFGDYTDPVYHSLIRVDKQFSFFVPGEKSKVKNWFELKSFDHFLSFDPTGKKQGSRRGDRFNEWQKALDTKGDQLSGWYDVAVALEGNFTAALPRTYLFSIKNKENENEKENKKKNIDVTQIYANLENNKIDETLFQYFKKNKRTLSDKAKVESLKKGSEWFIVDETRKYLVAKQVEKIKNEKTITEEVSLSVSSMSELKQTQEGAKSRIAVIASVDILELNPMTEEQRERQKTNHSFLLELIRNLSLKPEIAALSNVGNETNRFDVLDSLVQEAEKIAKESRKELEEDRKSKRAKAKEKYKKATEENPSQPQKIDFGGMFSIDVGEYIPDEQRIAIEQAEQELEQALSELKKEERKKIELIEYQVANATRVQKNSVRLYGTFTSPFLILLIGLFAFYLNQNSRRN